MPVVPVEDAAADRLSPYRGVSDPDLARRMGLFVAEGRLVVERLVRSKGYRVDSLLVTPAALSSLAAALTDLDSDVPIFVAPPVYIETLAGFNLHRGCLALAERPAPSRVASLVDRAYTIVVIDSVTNADNVGGIFRNAAAFGVDAVILSPTACDPLYRKAIRTSMAATLSVPFARADRWPSELASLRQAGFKVVALSPRAGTTLDEFAASVAHDQRLALVLGTEGAGISTRVEIEADTAVRIPTTSAVDSLNVAVASGIALSRLARRR